MTELRLNDNSPESRRAGALARELLRVRLLEDESGINAALSRATTAAMEGPEMTAALIHALSMYGSIMARIAAKEMHISVQDVLEVLIAAAVKDDEPPSPA